MKIAHVIPHVGQRFGGSVAAAAAMIAGLSDSAQSVILISTHGAGDGDMAQFPPEVDLRVCRSWGPGRLRRSRRLWSIATSLRMSLVHSHGLWTDVNRLAASMKRSKGVPHVLGPCGMLAPRALRRSRRKKQLALSLFQARALDEADCLLANSQIEYEDIRRFGLLNPVAVIPNPILGPDADAFTVRDSVAERFPVFANRRTALFLGRLHASKGLERLVNAWARLGEARMDWNLVLAGPDEDGYQAEIAARARGLGCEDSVRFIGNVTGRLKWQVFRRADLFVMPSDYENFGLAIAEAMLAGKPVITTTATPWSILNEQHAGWCVPPNIDELAETLALAMRLSPDELKDIGGRARSIAARFTPDSVAKKLVAMYSWLISGGDPPEFVRLSGSGQG